MLCDRSIVKGKMGSIAVNEGQAVMGHPVLGNRFVDSTGAGDTYVAGFIVEYLWTGDAVRAATFGACHASFKEEEVGVPALLTGNMVKARLGASRLNLSISRFFNFPAPHCIVFSSVDDASGQAYVSFPDIDTSISTYCIGCVWES